MISILGGKLLSWLLTAGAAIIAIGGVYLKGRRDSSLKHKADAQKKKLETIETVKGLAKDAAKTDDSDLANRLTKRR